MHSLFLALSDSDIQGFGGDLIDLGFSLNFVTGEDFFNVLKYLIPIFTSIIIGLLAFFGGVWAYKLNNIAEPIGGLKVEVQYLKEGITELKAEVNSLQDRLNNRPAVQ